jgi:hypothetical protein
VQAVMGHEDISMTLQHTHLSSDHKQRAGRYWSPLRKSPHHLPYRGEGRGQ